MTAADHWSPRRVARVWHGRQYPRAGTAEAITLLEQNLADRERALGADHHDTLATRDNLAAAYQDAGRTAQAITLHEQPSTTVAVSL